MSSKKNSRLAKRTADSKKNSEITTFSKCYINISLHFSKCYNNNIQQMLRNNNMDNKKNSRFNKFGTDLKNAAKQPWKQKATKFFL